MGLRVLADGTVLVQTSHRKHECKTVQLDEFDVGSYDQIFSVVPTHSTGSFSSLSSSSMSIDCVGGKTAENTAMDIFDTWAALQFQQPEGEPYPLLREPQPVQVMFPAPYITQPADLERSAFTRSAHLNSESDSEGSDSSGFWDPPFYDVPVEWTTNAAEVPCEDAVHVVCQDDCCGGSGVFLPVEVVERLPVFFFDHNYLHALAAASSTMLSVVRDKKNWQGLVVDIEQPDLLVSARLRSMIDLLSSARWICANIHQLSMLLIVPANLRLNWTPIPVRRPALLPFMMFGFASLQPLLGVAEFDIVLPAELRGLVVGVREWRGDIKFYCRIDNIFQRSITWSLGLNDHPPTPYLRASRFAPLPNRSNRFRLRWNSNFFSVELNDEGVLRGTVSAADEFLAPPLSQVFIWGFGPQRPQAVRPRISAVPSLIQLNAPIRCAICRQEHTIMTPRWCVCPVCTTWVCSAHVGETPWRRCPNCECHLHDYLGGADDTDGVSSVQTHNARSLSWNGGLLVCNPSWNTASLDVDFLGGSAA